MKILFLISGVAGGMMKTLKARFIEIFSALLLLLPALAGAAPLLVNYQGRLVDTAGNPLAGPLSIRFSVHDAATAGSELWFETQPAINPDNGIFSVGLGSVTPLPASVFGADARYLEIKIGADPALTPRTRLLSTPYALYTANLGSSLTQALISTDTIMTSSQFRLGNFAALPGSIGEGSVVYDAVGKQVNFWNGTDWTALAAGGVSPWSTSSGKVILVDGEKNVGVGTGVPAYKLHVSSGAGETGFLFAVSTGTADLVRINGSGSVYANRYYGDGSTLTNIADVNKVAKAGDVMTGTLVMNAASAFNTTDQQAIVFSTNVYVENAQLRLGNFSATPEAYLAGKGAVYFDTDDNTIYVSNGLSWSPLASGGASPWSSGGGITALVTPSDMVGVGRVPTEKLHVDGNIKSDYALIAATITLTGGIHASSATLTGNAEVRGVIIAGSGSNIITTAAGLVDATKVSGNIPGNAANVTNTVAVGNGGTGLTATGADGNLLRAAGGAWESFVPSYLTAEVDGVIGNEVTDAANGTLLRSGAGTSGDPYKLAVNVHSTNTWTAEQTISSVEGFNVPYGIDAGTITLTGGITASSSTVTGESRIGGVIIAGSGSNIITTAAGLVDATKVSGNISGNAANVSGTVAVGNGGTGLTATGADGNLLRAAGGAWESFVPSYLTAEVDGVIGNEVTDAANGTLLRSGAGTSGDPYKLAVNVHSTNTWTAEQTISSVEGLNVPYGIDAGTITLTGGITASSATLTGDAEIRGKAILPAGSLVSVTAASTLASGQTYLRVESATAGDATLAGAPLVAAGVSGQMLILEGTDNTKTVTIPTGGNVKLQGGTPLALGVNDTITLVYNGAGWIELSRSVNAD